MPRPEGELTAREREVAALLSEGLTNGELARRLYISPKTVAVHVSNILMKLHLSNRAEVAAWAVRTGWPTTCSAKRAEPTPVAGSITVATQPATCASSRASVFSIDAWFRSGTCSSSSSHGARDGPQSNSSVTRVPPGTGSTR